MFVAHVALLALVGSTPLLLFFDNLLVDGVVELCIAITLIMLALSIRPGEAGHWVKTICWAAALVAIPALWLIIQLLPLPAGAVSGSIWRSAAAALGVPLSSSITIDPGLTLLALSRYLSMIAIAAIAAAVSIDRQQAEKLLFALGAATLVLSLISIVVHLGDFSLTGSGSNSVRAAATAGSIYGVILIAAIVILIVERHLTRRASQDFRRQFLVPLAGAVGGFAICCLAAMAAGFEYAIFAAGCGFAAVAIIQFVRRIGLDWRAGLAMAGVAIVGATVIVSTKGHPALADFSVRYSASATADVIAVADRMIGEVGIGGSGGGTFGAIYRLYAAGDTPNISAPTSAAQIAIELGRPALWLIVACMFALIVLCGRGGFNRGRDFFYPTAGAGVTAATLVLGFCDIGLNNLAVSILLATTIGLALAQSVSRTI